MKKNVDLIRRIASERMDRLFELADAKTRSGGAEPEKLAQRYVSMLRKISTHYKVKLPRAYADRICKDCNRVLTPGINCSVRVASAGGYIVYKCACGAEKHVFYNKRATLPRAARAGR